MLGEGEEEYRLAWPRAESKQGVGTLQVQLCL